MNIIVLYKEAYDMKKGTVIGVTASVVCILALIGLGTYLMLDTRDFKTNRETSFPPSNTPVLIQAETKIEEETETAADAPTAPDSQTAAALSAAQAANSDLPEHQLIFVGDSRTVGMRNAEKELGDECIYIGETGEGYHWFADNGIYQMEDAIKQYPNAPVILNLGVNDPDMIDHYLELYSTFQEKYPNTVFYYMSVNPVTEEAVHITNAEISDFNTKLREAFPEQYLDCSTYLRIREFESVDGVHYSEDTYREIHDFVVKKLVK